MADVNLQLVREFFELNLFRVLTNWRQEPWRQRPGEPALQLFVERGNIEVPATDLPVLLRAGDLASIERALVEVRAWHADRFYPSVIESSPVLFQFVQGDSLALARELFDNRPFTTILVVSELPSSPELRARAVKLFEEGGIEHVIEFPVILQGVLARIDENANYAASQTLQTLRLLKRYRFIRHQQMEFPFPTEPPVAEVPAPVEATGSSETPADLLSGLDEETNDD